ncbi:CHAP domain-containing protein [Nocardioides sp. WS12]|uniref:CHAP domain-containing protein n=1 Tax=Nocardioides sp. WS12 TaxID=2486272 RepID=UPI0015F8163A|nr:CHAP domain-containing protein [Nocardioides sp. WS12]
MNTNSRKARLGLTGLVARGVLTGVLATVGLAGLADAPAQAATTRTVKGTVVCKGGHAVTGVWVQSSNGGSKWASFNRFAGVAHAAYFTASITTASSSTSIRLDIGCGLKSGTTNTWWSNNSTPNATVTGSRILNTRCAEASGNRAVRCTWPPKGQTVSSNLGAKGWCTYGALAQWKARAGYYPRTAGDAGYWDNTTATFGWYVSSVPHVRALVTFEPSSGSKYGHVAYATNVVHVGNGKFDVTVIEMNANHNGGGFGKYNTFTYRHVPGQMKYVVSTL